LEEANQIVMSTAAVNGIGVIAIAGVLSAISMITWANINAMLATNVNTSESKGYYTEWITQLSGHILKRHLGK